MKSKDDGGNYSNRTMLSGLKSKGRDSRWCSLLRAGWRTKGKRTKRGKIQVLACVSLKLYKEWCLRKILI